MVRTRAKFYQDSSRLVSALFEVNVFGPFRVTKAFAPTLIESKARIVTVCSISRTLSGPRFGPTA
jgi:NAD(P)-dependent dehydrogenase (short-subunit alcohol dehydrogenase family)